MNARPGSALWLLRHEIRLFWFNLGRGTRNSGTRHHPGKATIGVALATWLILHAGAFALLRHLEGSAAVPAQELLVPVTGVLVAVMTLMLSSGLKASVEVLFERADLDLLLSSPLPSRSIFGVRLAGMVLGIAALYLFFLAPFAHAGLLLGSPRWLAIYPTVIGAAALAASAAMLLTLGLVRTLGARRTRVVAQVLGALAGAFLFIASQVFSLLSRGDGTQAAGWLSRLLAPGAALGPGSLAWLPGRAALGDPWPLLGMSLLTAGAVWFTIRTTHGFFVHGLQQAAGAARAARSARAPRYRFGRSLAQVVVIKEWRLIVRDPHLISQVLLQLLYILPVCVPMLSARTPALPALGAGLTLLVGSLTASLAWIIISAEDAPDLLRVSPASNRTIRHAKLAAAAMPPLAIVALPLLWLLLRNPVAALLISFTAVASVLGSAMIVMWCGRPSARGEFKGRGKGNFMSNLFEMLSALAWGGLAFLLLMLSGGGAVSNLALLAAVIALGTGLAVLGAAWLLRRRVA